jgi:ubiquinone/menaquinone biosynthesis C-methylase UbiE
VSHQENISKSYKRLASKYDSMLSTESWLSRALCKVIWGFSETAYAKSLLELIPDDFGAELLDIPVGTGLFTSEKYAKLTQANITCVDYSCDMMGMASERFHNAGIENVVFHQGDVGNLVFPDNTFDIVLSMNGFHAFPDKEAAYYELTRVLKQGGLFIGCFYIKNENRRTDWFIRHFYVQKKYFTPPFQTLGDVSGKLKQTFSQVKIWNTEAILCFCCVK